MVKIDRWGTVVMGNFAIAAREAICFEFRKARDIVIMVCKYCRV